VWTRGTEQIQILSFKPEGMSAEKTEKEHRYRSELDADNYSFYPSYIRRNIMVNSVLLHKKGRFVFDGNFYMHPSLFRPDRPIKVLMGFRRHIFLIAIHKKLDLKDTSDSWSDDEGYRICLFPTKIIELNYAVLEMNPSKERFDELAKETEEEFRSLYEESSELERRDREIKLKEVLGGSEDSDAEIDFMKEQENEEEASRQSS